MTKPLAKHPDRFVETAIDDETVVMDIDSAEFFSLNETAGAVWRAIDGKRDRDEVLAAVAAEYGIDAQDIAADVDEVLGRFVDAGFLG
ncbi:MAG: PqqD family protein [Novosphingobium sp.]